MYICICRGSLAMPITSIHQNFMSRNLPFERGWHWAGAFRDPKPEVSLVRYFSHCFKSFPSFLERFNDDGLVMQYKENLYTFKFLFSWFFVNGKQIFEEPNPHAICMRPDVFPKVDCDFMKMYFFATGKRKTNIDRLGSA